MKTLVIHEWNGCEWEHTIRISDFAESIGTAVGYVCCSRCPIVAREKDHLCGCTSISYGCHNGLNALTPDSDIRNYKRFQVTTRFRYCHIVDTLSWGSFIVPKTIWALCQLCRENSFAKFLPDLDSCSMWQVEPIYRQTEEISGKWQVPAPSFFKKSYLFVRWTSLADYLSIPACITLEGQFVESLLVTTAHLWISNKSWHKSHS